jgi:hypothetical protein
MPANFYPLDMDPPEIGIEARTVFIGQLASNFVWGFHTDNKSGVCVLHPESGQQVVINQDNLLELHLMLLTNNGATLQDPTNDSRASWAAAAIDFYGALIRTPDDEPATTHVHDLLCDLMHFCSANGIDFDDTLNSARGTYQSEL